MKYLFVLLFVFLTGCSQDLRVGDCYRSGRGGVTFDLKIVKVGEYAYESVDRDGELYETYPKDTANKEKIDCFNFSQK